MIKLPPISEENKKDFLDYIKPKYKEWCDNNLNQKQYQDLCNYLINSSGLLDESKLEEIIIGDKTALERIIKAVGPLNYDDTFKKLYDFFSKNDFGKTWANKNGISTCPYCNRSYIFSVHDKNKNIRPEYDHYYCKSKYAYLCVSMYNLIPCCSVCNKAKGAFDVVDKGGFVYPYIDEYGYNIIFDLKYDSPISLYNGKHLTVDICNSDGTQITDKKFTNTISQLALQKLYQQHMDYIEDLIVLAHIYTNDFIEGLKKDFFWLFLSEDDLRDRLFLSRLDKDEWGKRILSKLTHDIIKKYRF